MFCFIYLWYKCQMLNLFSETSWPLLEIRFVANKPWCTLKEYHPLHRITTFWKGSIVLKPRYLVNAYRKSVDFRKGLLNIYSKEKNLFDLDQSFLRVWYILPLILNRALFKHYLPSSKGNQEFLNKKVH